MAYSTLNDFLEQLAEIELVNLTDDNGLGVVDQARIDWAIAKADAVIDAHMPAGKYVLPFSPVPALARSFSVDLGIFNLFARRPNVGDIPEAIKEQRNAALAYLKRVQAGEAGMGADAATPAASSTSVDMLVSSNDRIFPASLLERM
jgi:phage gp36-like protein